MSKFLAVVTIVWTIACVCLITAMAGEELATAKAISTANVVDEKDSILVVNALNNLAKGKVFIGDGAVGMVVDASFAPKGDKETEDAFLSRVSASMLSTLVLLSQKVDDKKTMDAYIQAMPKPIREKIDYVK